jgi:hypothetical protein
MQVPAKKLIKMVVLKNATKIASIADINANRYAISERNANNFPAKPKS